MSNGCRTHSTGTTTGDWNLSAPSTETAKQSLTIESEGLSFPKEPERKKDKLKYRSLLPFYAPPPERPGELARRLVSTACLLYRELKVKQ